MLRLIFFVLTLFSVSCVSAGNARDSYMKMQVVKSDFETVRDYIELAITGRGMIVNNVSHIGNMLERTGKDLGETKQIFAKAEALEFCSASISRQMMAADPHNIVFFPYIIAIYTLPGEEGKVYVSYRRPQQVGSDESRQALAAVEQLLQEIVAEAVN